MTSTPLAVDAFGACSCRVGMAAECPRCGEQVVGVVVVDVLDGIVTSSVTHGSLLSSWSLDRH